MIPVHYQNDNHAILFYDTNTNKIHFSVHNVKHLKGNRITVDFSLEDAEETRKGLVGIVSILTKLEPQLWGWSPSRCEIPLLMKLLTKHAVPYGVLGQNPAPGRGTSYHKEFMEWVWNAMPFYGNANNIPGSPEEHNAEMRGWVDGLLESKTFCKAMKHNLQFVEPTDNDDYFAHLSNVLHTIAEIAAEEIEEIE